jgi:hypothetical protein
MSSYIAKALLLSRYMTQNALATENGARLGMAELKCPPLTDCVEKVPGEHFGAVFAQQSFNSGMDIESLLRQQGPARSEIASVICSPTFSTQSTQSGHLPAFFLAVLCSSRF